MSDAGLKQKIRGHLKYLGPVYYLARKVRQQTRRAFFEILRYTLPAWPRLGPAKGGFSACDELRAGHLRGEILLEWQNVKPSPPDSLKIRAHLGQEGHQPWPIFWTHHVNARLVGKLALLMDERKHACAEALYYIHQDGDPGYNALWLSPPMMLPGNWTSIIYRWGGNYYHWFTDCLPRLALLGRLPSDIKILLPADALKPFQMETLRWLGLADRIRLTSERHLRVENYYFSSPTAMTGCVNFYAAEFLRGKFLQRADNSYAPVEKIYILRRGKTRGIINEPELAAFLAQRGWRGIDLETLTLAQQISLFSNARAVCGLHGAGFTNLLWCRPGCVAVELMPSNFINGCYESLAETIGVEHRFLIQSADEHNRIRVNLDELARLLPD